ncbi:probable serine/threonine-protein kinase irlF [Microplitis mediator]|uniref:probable serine/threonine-protein kinase irlF n=1 Tax=Microplitis mediator TaxID=375433 RepID=UPI002553BCC8|nr:probable serine/threonine-protein kinase irlF [Microplitis mediator]XP_057322068.1 probable serine/threonine-protein kinase irlF [Microplitis mediator]XP_057334578.1 probable serine/threonine-protein kinase irlF [Microplitis mediator]
MKYALIKIPKEDKRAVVETCYIKKFSDYGAYTKNCVYRYNDGRKKCRCLILHVSNSKEKLANPNFRVREPVVTNPSSLESSSSDDDEEDQSLVNRLKAARKEQKQNVIKSKKQKVEDIITTYKNNRESSEGKVSIGLNSDDKNKKIFNNDDQIEEQSLLDNEDPSGILVNESIEDRHAELDGISQTRNRSIIPDSDSEDDMFGEPQHKHIEANVKIINNNEVSYSESIAPPASNEVPNIILSDQDQNGNRRALKNITNFEPKQLTMRLMQDSRKKDDEIKNLKRQNQEYRVKVASYHQNLQRLQQQQQQEPQQELQQQPQQQPQRQHQRQQQQQPQHQDRYNPYYYLEHDEFHVGDNIYIRSTESRKAFDATDPPKFIKIMSHAIWGVNNISKLVVRKQKNTGNREELDARRLELLSIHYQHFLKQRNYSEGVFVLQLRAMNRYLDRAIQSAKKTVRRSLPEA